MNWGPKPKDAGRWKPEGGGAGHGEYLEGTCAGTRRRAAGLGQLLPQEEGQPAGPQGCALCQHELLCFHRSQPYSARSWRTLQGQQLVWQLAAWQEGEAP